MKTLWLMRHGQSLANLAGLHGKPNALLTLKGRDQAAERAKEFADQSFDAIWTSTNLRAVQTGQYFADKSKFGCITGASGSFNERSFGVLEQESGQKQLAKLKTHLDHLPKHQRCHIRFVADMESDLDAYMRFSTGLWEILDGGDNILIITHRNVMRMFLDYADIISLPQGSIENCGYVKLELDGQEFKLLETKGVTHDRNKA